MTDPVPDYEKWTGNFDTHNTESIARIHLTEVQEQRRAQDKYVDDIRSRSVGILGIVSGSVLLVAAFAEIQTISSEYIWLASLGVVLLVFCAIQVHRPRDGFFSGPDLSEEIEVRQKDGDLFVLVLRDLAEWLSQNVHRNASGPIKRLQWWFTAELASAGAIVIAILLGLATVSPDAEGSAPAIEAEPVTTQPT